MFVRINIRHYREEVLGSYFHEFVDDMLFETWFVVWIEYPGNHVDAEICFVTTAVMFVLNFALV